MLESSSGETSGALLSVMDACSTPAGRRRLKDWLCRPAGQSAGNHGSPAGRAGADDRSCRARSSSTHQLCRFRVEICFRIGLPHLSATTLVSLGLIPVPHLLLDDSLLASFIVPPNPSHCKRGSSALPLTVIRHIPTSSHGRVTHESHLILLIGLSHLQCSTQCLASSCWAAHVA